MKIAILDDYQDVSLKLGNWDSLKPNVRAVRFTDYIGADQDKVVDRLKDFEMVLLMRERTPFPRSLIERLPKLKLLITTGPRNAAIDLAACTEKGIQVCGTRNEPHAAAELTWGLILSLARHIPFENDAFHRGKWQTTIGAALFGKKLGVIGLGNYGSQVARVGKAFGMNVVAWSTNLTKQRADEVGADLVSKDQLMRESDFISIHLVLSARSKGIVAAEDIAKMKPSSYLINTSRAQLVDEEALIKALRGHKIAGAGIDVFTEEPLSKDHPFRSMDNVVATPHLGYVVDVAYSAFYSDAVENIKSFLKGEVTRGLNKLAQ